MAHPSSRPSMLMPSLGGTPLKADVTWAREKRPMVFAGAIRINRAGLLLSADCGVVHKQKTPSIASVQPELSDESWIGPDLTSFDALDGVSQYCVGPASYSDLLTLAHDPASFSECGISTPMRRM